MKRMITQELINKIEALVNDAKLETLLNSTDLDEGDLILSPDGIHLESVEDIDISDLGSLFPTPEDDKLLAWGDGVLKNVNFPVDFTHSFSELDASLQALCESAIEAGTIGVACSQAQWDTIKALLDKSLYINYSGSNLINSWNNGIDFYDFGTCLLTSEGEVDTSASLKISVNDGTLYIIYTEV